MSHSALQKAAIMPAIWQRAWGVFFFHYHSNSTFLPTFHWALTSWHKMLFHQVLINGLFGLRLGTYACITLFARNSRRHLVWLDAGTYSRHKHDITIQIYYNYKNKMLTKCFSVTVCVMVTVKITSANVFLKSQNKHAGKQQWTLRTSHIMFLYCSHRDLNCVWVLDTGF